MVAVAHSVLGDSCREGADGLLHGEGTTFQQIAYRVTVQLAAPVECARHDGCAHLTADVSPPPPDAGSAHPRRKVRAHGVQKSVSRVVGSDAYRKLDAQEPERSHDRLDALELLGGDVMEDAQSIPRGEDDVHRLRDVIIVPRRFAGSQPTTDKVLGGEEAIDHRSHERDVPPAPNVTLVVEGVFCRSHSDVAVLPDDGDAEAKRVRDVAEEPAAHRSRAAVADLATLSFGGLHA